MPRPRKSRQGFSEGQRKYEPELPERLRLTLGPGGRIVIPAVYRHAMNIKEGDLLMARLVEGELRLITPELSIKRAQQIVRETIPPGVDLVGSLIEERRWEVAKELEDD